MVDFKTPFSHIKFDPIPHTYTSEKGSYTSVTTVIGKFEKEFQTELISRRTADKKGIPQEEVKALWQIAKEYGCVRGTELHLYIETFLRYGRKIDTITGIEHQVSEFHRFWDLVGSKFEIVELEILVGDDDYMISGTADALFRNKETGKYHVFDWKTNKHISTTGWNSLSHPISHLDDSEINVYSLQLSTYRYFLEKNFDVEFGNNCIVHFGPPPNRFQMIPLEYKKKEVTDMLGVFNVDGK